MIDPKLSLNLDGFKASFFSNVMSEVERAQKKNTEILAGQTRVASKNSMKKASSMSKKKQALLIGSDSGEMFSRPGEPPLEKIGLVKRHLYYAWDSSTQSAFIGPAKLNMRGSVPESLEHGRPTLMESGVGAKRKLFVVPIPARPYMRPALAKVMTPANLKRVYEKSMKPRKGF